MSSISSNSPKSRLGRLFHRRGPSDAFSHGSSPQAAASAAFPAALEAQNGALETGHVPRRSSKRSIRDFVQTSGRSRSGSGNRRISLQREQLQREPSYNAPQNLPSGAEVAAAKALYPDGKWAPVSSTNDNFPLSASQIQGGNTNVTEDPRGPPIYESRRSRPTTANSQTNGQPVERMLAQQQQERLLEHEYSHAGMDQAHGNPAYAGTAAISNTNRQSRELHGHNHVPNGDQRVGGLEDFPDPLRVTKSRTSLSSEAGRASLDRPRRVSGQLSHKPDVTNLRRSIDSDIGVGVGVGIAIPPRTSFNQHGQEGRHIRKSSLQKPLPEPPVERDASLSRFIQQPNTHTPNHDAHPSVTRARDHGIQNSSTPIDLTDIVDLRNTEDVDFHTTYAPAVTHETVTVTHHEDVQEIITRETHNHHIFHRILPVIDFEVLPPRHFIETRMGGKYEISPDVVPPGTNEQIQTLIHDAVNRMMPHSNGPAFPTNFSARSFHGNEGEHHEWIGPYGERRTEQWWVHPPTWETGGNETGQTEAFHFGSQYEEDNGLRTPLPDDTSKWPQVLRRASMVARPQSQRLSMSAREVPEYREYQQYVHQDEANGMVRQAPPVPRHEPGAQTVLPIRMQHEPGHFQEGMRF